ncbi:MAG TPA: hypothetical protein VGL62_09100 [Vicinamibacterales bacterium]
MLDTNYGAYWRCSKCGHVWHEDARPRPRFPPFFERYWTCTAVQFGRDLIQLRPWLTPSRPRRKVCA